MKSGFLVLAALAVCLLSGCAGSPVRLSGGDLPQQHRVENIARQNNVPVSVDIRSPENVPAVNRKGKVVGFYPLSNLVRESTLQAVDTNFRLPRAGEVPPFKYHLQIQSSRLSLAPKHATYDLRATVFLQDLYGRTMWRGNFQSLTQSPYDRERVPDAVWSGLASIHTQAIRALSADTFTMSQLHAPVPGAVTVTTEAPRVTVYECDVRVVDLRGRQILSVSGKAATQVELRGLAGALCKELLEKWDPVDLPRVAVIEFRTLGDADGQHVGPVFAAFFEDALLRSPSVQLLDRERLALIMQEHNLRASDLTANPGNLAAMNLNLETVDFFVFGQV